MVRSLPLNELRKDRTMSIADAVAAPDMRDITLPIEGMTCATCAGRLEASSDQALAPAAQVAGS